MGILIAWNSPANTYEPSIYADTPLIFWVAVCINLFVGVALVIHHLFVTNEKRSADFPVIPFILVILSFVAVLSLFIVRGYSIWSGGDSLTHLGYIKDITYNSHIDSGNYYPIVHIYVAQFFEICNISLLALSKFIPLIFALLSVLFTYVFAKMVLKEKGQIILATMLSMTFLGGWFLDLTPNCLANLTLPLALFLMMKFFSSEQLQWKILFIIIIFLFPVFHPVPGFILLLVLSTLTLMRRIYLKRTNPISLVNGEAIFYFKGGIVVLYIVWAFTWISSLPVFGHEIGMAYNAITEGSINQIGALENQINYAVGFHYSIVGMFFKTYGGLLILSVATLVALVVLWRKRAISELYLASFTGPLAIISFAIIAFFVTSFGFSPTRLITYLVTIFSLFTAYILRKMVNINVKKYFASQSRAMSILLTILILCLFILGGLQVYPSRYILTPNYQITKTDLFGMDWFLRNSNPKKDSTYVTLAVYRFADLFLTQEEKNARIDLNRFKDGVQYHFGYDNSTKLGEYYSQDIYLCLDQKDRIYYEEIFPEVAKTRFETQDFEKLEDDNSVDKLFDSGGFWIYYIRGLIPKGIQ